MFPFFILTLACIGGGIFYALGVPLGWLLGALFFSAFASFFCKDFYMPDAWRQGAVGIVGIIVGSLVTVDVMNDVVRYYPTIIFMMLCQLAFIVFGLLFFTRYHKFDGVTGFLAAFPGGVSQVSALSLEKQCDLSVVTLNHASRLFLVISVIPIMAFMVLSDSYSYSSSQYETDYTELNHVFYHYLVPVVICVVGLFFAKLFKLMVPALYGPMFLACVLSVLDFFPNNFHVGQGLIFLAQVIIGAAVGLSLFQTGKVEIKKIVSVHFLFAASLLVLTAIFAYLSHKVFGLSFVSGLLIIAPGGLSEMILIAYALNIDPLFVATHHIVRSLCLLLLVPLMLHLISRFWCANTKTNSC